jgi:hypothetical protein
MRLFALATAPKLRLAIACAAVFALASIPSFAQDDPPDQAGRVSSITGTVSIQTAGSDDWGQAYPNLPIAPGDRIFTDQDGQVELQVGQSYLRIGPNTDITLVNEDQSGITFGVAQGSVHLHSFGFWQGMSLDLSTPNGDAHLAQAGELRADVMPDQGLTIFTSLGNGAVITGASGFFQQMGNGQSLELAGTNPVYPQWLQPNGPDSLDQWSQQRDEQIMNAASYRYVNPEVPGAAELDAYGDWTQDSDYGPMWFPRNVPAGWEPYHYGHWINRDPWGWVWVEDEQWGYAPFHYGRWVSYRGRWGWIPGAREERPVWSPALVVFAGGINVGGVGVSAWFPLGPGEPYRPWYACSPRYIDRVNITNIHESRVIHVQTTYVNIVNIHNVTNVTYVNRTIGASAMRQEDFAAGRPVRQAAVNVDARQFDRVQVVDRPAPVTRQSIITRPVARPVPVTGTRPVFINHQGMQISAKPGVPPQAPPVRQIQQVRTVPGRTVVAPPQGNQYQNRGSVMPNSPNQPPTRPMPPANDGRQNPGQPAGNSNGQQPGNEPGVRPNGRPVMPNNGQQPGYPNQMNGTRPTPPAAAQPAPPANNQPQGRPSPPPSNDRQDFGPVQPSRRQGDQPPPPPANNQQQVRPAPPPPPAQTRPNNPPRSAQGRPESSPPQQNKSDKPAKPDKGDNKNKEPKKDDKKEHD